MGLGSRFPSALLASGLLLCAAGAGCVPREEQALYRCKLPERTCEQTDPEGRPYVCGQDSLCVPVVDRAPAEDSDPPDGGPGPSNDAGFFVADAGERDAGDRPDAGPSGQPCLVQGECGAGDYCAFAIGGCGLNGRDGVCQPKPGACPSSVGRVCGCDGVSYPSACAAAMQGVSLRRDGGC